MTEARLLLIPEERVQHPRSTEPGSYAADEASAKEREDKGRLAFFTPSGKNGVGPSYVGPPSRLTTWQRWRAWATTYLGI